VNDWVLLAKQNASGYNEKKRFSITRQKTGRVMVTFFFFIFLYGGKLP